MLQYISQSLVWNSELDPYKMIEGIGTDTIYVDNNIDTQDPTEAILGSTFKVSMFNWPVITNNIPVISSLTDGTKNYEVIYRKNSATIGSFVLYIEPVDFVYAKFGSKILYKLTENQLRYVMYNNLFSCTPQILWKYYAQGKFNDACKILTTKVVVDLSLSGDKVAFGKFSQDFLLLPQNTRQTFIEAYGLEVIGTQRIFMTESSEFNNISESDFLSIVGSLGIQITTSCLGRLRELADKFQLPIGSGTDSQLRAFLIHIFGKPVVGVAHDFYMYIMSGVPHQRSLFDFTDPTVGYPTDVMLHYLLDLDTESNVRGVYTFESVVTRLWDTTNMAGLLKSFTVPYYIKVGSIPVAPSQINDTVIIQISQTTDTAVKYTIDDIDDPSNIQTTEMSLADPMAMYNSLEYDDNNPNNAANMVSLVVAYTDITVNLLQYFVDKFYVHGLREWLLRTSDIGRRQFLKDYQHIDPLLYLIGIEVASQYGHTLDPSMFEGESGNFAFDSDLDEIRTISDSVLSSVLNMLANEHLNSTSRPIGTFVECHLFGNEIPHCVEFVFRKPSLANIDIVDAIPTTIQCSRSILYPAGNYPITRVAISDMPTTPIESSYFRDYRFDLNDALTDGELDLNSEHSHTWHSQFYDWTLITGSLSRVGYPRTYENSPDLNNMKAKLASIDYATRSNFDVDATLDYTPTFKYLEGPDTVGTLPAANLSNRQGSRLTLSILQSVYFIKPSSYSYFGLIYNTRLQPRANCHQTMIAGSGVINVNLPTKKDDPTNRIVNFMGRDPIPVWVSSSTAMAAFSMYNNKSSTLNGVTNALQLTQTPVALRYGSARSMFMDFPIVNDSVAFSVYTPKIPGTLLPSPITHVLSSSLLSACRLIIGLTNGETDISDSQSSLEHMVKNKSTASDLHYRYGFANEKTTITIKDRYNIHRLNALCSVLRPSFLSSSAFGTEHPQNLAKYEPIKRTGASSQLTAAYSDSLLSSETLRSRLLYSIAHKPGTALVTVDAPVCGNILFRQYFGPPEDTARNMTSLMYPNASMYANTKAGYNNFEHGLHISTMRGILMMTIGTQPTFDSPDFGTVSLDQYEVGKHSYPYREVLNDEWSTKALMPGLYVAVNGVTQSNRPEIRERILNSDNSTTFQCTTSDVSAFNFRKYVFVRGSHEYLKDYKVTPLVYAGTVNDVYVDDPVTYTMPVFSGNGNYSNVSVTAVPEVKENFLKYYERNGNRTLNAIVPRANYTKSNGVILNMILGDGVGGIPVPATGARAIENVEGRWPYEV